MFRIKSGNIFVCKLYFSFLFFYSADLNLQMHKGADLNPDPQHWVQLLISGLYTSSFYFLFYLLCMVVVKKLVITGILRRNLTFEGIRLATSFNN